MHSFRTVNSALLVSHFLHNSSKVFHPSIIYRARKQARKVKKLESAQHDNNDFYPEQVMQPPSERDHLDDVAFVGDERASAAPQQQQLPTSAAPITAYRQVLIVFTD